MRKLEVTLQIQVLTPGPRVPENQKTLAFSRLLASARLLLQCSMKGPQCSGHAKEELSREIGFSFVQKIVGLL